MATMDQSCMFNDGIMMWKNIPCPLLQTLIVIDSRMEFGERLECSPDHHND